MRTLHAHPAAKSRLIVSYCRVAFIPTMLISMDHNSRDLALPYTCTHTTSMLLSHTTPAATCKACCQCTPCQPSQPTQMPMDVASDCLFCLFSQMPLWGALPGTSCTSMLAYMLSTTAGGHQLAQETAHPSTFSALHLGNAFCGPCSLLRDSPFDPAPGPTASTTVSLRLREPAPFSTA